MCQLRTKRPAQSAERQRHQAEIERVLGVVLGTDIGPQARVSEGVREKEARQLDRLEGALEEGGVAGRAGGEGAVGEGQEVEGGEQLNGRQAEGNGGQDDRRERPGGPKGLSGLARPST